MSKKKRFGCLLLSAALLGGALFGTAQAARNGGISGKVVSSDSKTNPVSLSLLSGDKVAYSLTVTGNEVTYDFSSVSAGTYTLRAEKARHVPLEYTVTVGSTAVTQDIKLLQLGDVTKDGRVNIADTSRIYAHVRGGNKLTDEYLISCADITGEGRLNIADVSKSYGNLRNGVVAAVYTVTFKDANGTVLKTQVVSDGQSATPPADPTGSGFIGWDKSFHKVTSDMTVTAQYESVQGACFRVGNVTGAPGQTVQVPVTVVNNPGVAGARITISYSKALTLTDGTAGEAFSKLQHTGPGKYVSPCNFTWDSESGMATADGTVLTLSFKIPATAKSGDTYEVNCTYRDGDIYDEDLNDVSFEMFSGTVTVK